MTVLRAADGLDFGDDAAVEQLYDELLARVTTLVTLVPSIGPVEPSLVLHHELVAAASAAVGELRTNPGAASGDWVRLLWPHGTAPSADHWWWSTPLGALIGPPDPTNGRTRDPTSSSCRSTRTATGVDSTTDLFDNRRARSLDR